jgi:hypothetical protein
MKSWVKYSKDTDFPIQNLPYGIFKPGTKAKPRVGVAIGDYVLDLAAVSKAVDVRSSNLYITLYLSYRTLIHITMCVCVCVLSRFNSVEFMTFFCKSLKFSFRLVPYHNLCVCNVCVCVMSRFMYRIRHVFFFHKVHSIYHV